METIKLAQLRDKRTATTFNLKAVDAKEIEMNIKFDNKEEGFSFKINTNDIQVLAKCMIEFAQEMEMDNWNNKR